jgi:hypothetical protein
MYFERFHSEWVVQLHRILRRILSGDYLGQGRGWGMVSARMYEIIFSGEAVPAITAAFEEFDVTIGCGCTTLRAELPDQAALHGTLERMMSLGLELLEVRSGDPNAFVS